jgi:hypothetical protein
MLRLSEAEVRLIRLKVAMLADGRCREVDGDGCRCLVRRHGHTGAHDFSYTPYTLSPVEAARAGATS